MNMKEKLQELAETARKRIQEADAPDKLNEVKVAYLEKRRAHHHSEGNEGCSSGRAPEGGTACQ